MALTDVILLVEADARERLAMQRALQLRGYAVLTAESSSDAAMLALRCASPIRLLLADAACTGMGVGFLVREISQASPHVRVLLTCKKHECQPQGYEQLRKPFTMSELAQKVRAVLSNSATVHDDA